MGSLHSNKVPVLCSMRVGVHQRAGEQGRPAGGGEQASQGAQGKISGSNVLFCFVVPRYVQFSFISRGLGGLKSVCKNSADPL
jgi:hypothetical protein